MDWLNGILQVIKLPIKFIIIIVLSISIVLILPNSFLISFGIDKILNNYKGYFSLALICGIVYLSVNIIIYIIKKFKQKRKRIQEKTKEQLINKAINKSITELDSTEQGILREFILSGQNTIELPVTNASVAALLQKNILIFAGNYQKNTILGILKPLKLNDYIFDVLNPKMINIQIDSFGELRTLKENDWQQFRRKRPAFMNELDRFRIYLG